MPDEEMIDRLALAACKFEQPDRDYISLNKFGKTYYVDLVKTIIKAMREPTEKMIEAGCEGNPTFWNECTYDGFAANVASDVYQSMIDEILK